MARSVSRTAIACVACLIAGTACAPESASGPAEPQAAEQGQLLVADILAGGSTEGYARALEPRRFRFPDDHGPHPDFRNEWWYFTGNLQGPEGERYGYQLTVFRTSLSSEPVKRDSSWATRQVHMAHFALGDERAGTFRAADRFSRAAVGLAGAVADPMRVWLEDWEIAALGPAGPAQTGSLPGDPVSLPPLRLRAAIVDAAIDLSVEPSRPIVLNGVDGLSRKGPSPGNASYYYSVPRLETRGTIRSGGREIAVEGTSWLDREWSTSALEDGQVGWDWFALHLSDGRDLMIYLLREEGGGVSPQSAGTLIDPDGGAVRLDREQIAVRVLDTWDSPGGSTYPSAWRVEVPEAAIALRIEPMLANQELDVAFRYWEGAVAGEGTSGDTAITVEGFVELTGY